MKKDQLLAGLFHDGWVWLELKTLRDIFANEMKQSIRKVY
jgi:hypothetical protein